ncbi:Leucine rich repeat, putative [Angomonas deanei]|uniref:Leucine rich repeat, putative n=1 Tax=Angomonas deanei TaxID=59799 RepID=A0A7G2CTV0_9TRYP|nr:Leucine rich repeat, putative [Angomonas deanei]
MGISGVTADNVCNLADISCANDEVTSMYFGNLLKLPAELPDHTVAPFNMYNYEEMTIEDIVCSHCDLLSGTLPAAWGRINTLERISLSSCKLEGMLPPQWGRLTRLEKLSLENNRLTGTLPPEWSSMAGLERLELSYNSLTGTLPPEWSSMPSLRYLEISANRIYGSIPPEWKYLSDLRRVDLSLNHLTGTLPAQWSNMPKLSQLFFNDNQLSGCIPESYTTQVFPSLTDFRVQMNPQMTGCVPPSWRDPQDVLYDAYTSLVEDNSPLVLENCTPCSKEATKSDKGSDKGGLSTGTIVGIVVGSVIAVVAILFLIIFFCCCRKDKKDVKSAADATGVAGGCATSAPLAENSEAACSFRSGEDEGPIRSGNEEPSIRRYSYYDDVD